MSDPFEREYLGATEALYSEKVRLRVFAAVMTATAGAFGLGALTLTLSGLGGDPWMLVGAGGSAALAAGFALFGLSFAVIRTVVTSSAIRVHMGSRELNVPLADIETVTAVEFGREERLAFHRSDAIEFGARARNDRVMRVRWREDGRVRTAYVTSDHADVLVDAVEKARAKVPRARVELEDASETEAETEAVEADRSSASSSG